MTSNLRDQLQATLSGSYTLERELGGGGMSRVFLAEETQLSRKVVVKVLSTEIAAEISAERFQREIRTAASLQQANIVPVLTAGNAGGVPYFTMPYVEGESLRARLGRTGALGITEAVKVMGDVARALAYAHDRGIVHRDIKPDNVLLSGGTAVVTDFGIAKAITAARTDAGGKSATLTQLGTALGTPAYMAPEQAAGDPSTDHRADFYAFGCTAYELITGRPPFVDKTPQRLLAAHMSVTPDAITMHRADVPQQLADLVMRCLEKEAPRRPATAGEIIAALDAVASTSGGSQAAMPAILLGGPAMFRKALAVYAGAFVVVAVLARAAIVGIGLPDWVFPGALIVMALGLPVILWTGYVQRVARRAATITPTYTPGGTPTTAHGTIATMALKAAPKMSWYRTARGGMYAMGAFIALIGIAMAMRVFGIGPFGTLFASGRLDRGASIVLSDFRTSNADTTLGRVVSDAVRAGLTGSSAFTLTSPAAVAAALVRMQRPPGTRLDSTVAREIAIREGLKAIVDGEVTGVTGGYIVTLRLVRADSGIELASFRETGDGPRGLIDAADKLARALRSKAGESLRRVNATPPLIQVTSASLDALRKFGEAARLNAQGDRSAVIAAREAVALDSTFASAWSMLGAMLSNYGGTQSAIDSALTQAYRYREKLPPLERDMITGRYFGLGPGRDRARSIAAYEAILQRGDTNSSVLINLAEQIRSRREFARAEALNLEAARLSPTSGTALGNAFEMQVNQGKIKEAAATAAKLREVAFGYGVSRQSILQAVQGDYAAQRALGDSLAKRGDRQTSNNANTIARNIALLEGRWLDFVRPPPVVTPPQLRTQPDAELGPAMVELTVRGRSPAFSARLDVIVARVPFRELSMVDRPYLLAAYVQAQAGHPDKARALIARYRTDVTDSTIRRDQESFLHGVLGEIALAEGKFAEARAEFERSETGYDGAPAHECTPCLPYDLARTFDAAGTTDSAIVMFERYVATPHWFRAFTQFDPTRLPAIHERLGQLYEAKGNADKAAEHYRRFIDLWRNADPELQPRVAAARERLRKLSPVERPNR